MDNTLGYRFALAVFRLAKKNGEDFSVFDKNLKKSIDLLMSDKKILLFLSHPVILFESKEKIVDSLTGDKIVKKLLTSLILTKKLELLQDVYKHFCMLVNFEQGAVDAQLKLPWKLEADEENILRKTIEKFTGKKVNLNVTVAPEIISGLWLKIGDVLIDNTLKTKLNQIKEGLLLK